MKRVKELAAFLAATLIALAAGLMLIRWAAPGLLGIGKDLQVVQLSKAIPAFYDNVFRDGKAGPDGYILQDPMTMIRAPVLYPERLGIGPNDVLGFRNRGVPNVADVITIGDSQTYGNNAILEDNWPSHMQRSLAAKKPIVYNMSTGGWGAVQYFAAFEHALRFQPVAVVVAFYTGNDPLESVIAARNIEHWKFLLDSDESIDATFPVVGKSEELLKVPSHANDWSVDLGPGISTSFSPGVRAMSNDPSSASAMAGFRVMAKVGKLIAERGRLAGVKVFITVIPTKELAYKTLLDQIGVRQREDYAQLVHNEQRNIAAFAAYFQASASTPYIDLVAPLQAAIGTQPAGIYPRVDGHPWPEGYRVIGTTIARQLDSVLTARPKGAVAVTAQKDFPFDEILPGQGVAGGVRLFDDGSRKVVYMNIEGDTAGYLNESPNNARNLPRIGVRDIANLPIASVLRNGGAVSEKP